MAIRYVRILLLLILVAMTNTGLSVFYFMQGNGGLSTIFGIAAFCSFMAARGSANVLASMARTTAPTDT